MPMEYTEKYKRIRIRSPAQFKKDSFRTLDVGKTGYHKIIRGRLKKNDEWKTQAIIIERDVANNLEVQQETKEIIKKVKKE